MTIFGFNTDVKQGETVYHVQSEARPSDLLVQTLVFVKGKCVGKRNSSYAEQVSHAEFSDQAIHELLKTQHKTVIDAITAGKMDSVLGTSIDIQDIGSAGLSLQWMKSEPVTSRSIVVHFQVTDAGQSVGGAEVISRAGSAVDAPVLARGISDDSGNVEMHVLLTEDLLREAAITVQATHGEKSVTRKFRMKRSGS